MDIDKLMESGCPKCGSNQISIEVSTPVSRMSAGGFTTTSCHNGNRHEHLTCSGCGYENHEDSYSKENDKRNETARKLLAGGGHRLLLQIED